MATMSPRERFVAAVTGEEVDRLPVSVWLHFASEHYRGEEVARLHARFQEEYGFDYVKAMNDYRYPLPDGVEAVETKDDLARFEPVSLDHPTFAEQLSFLRTLRVLLGPDVPIVETVFSPVQTLLRGAGDSARAAVIAHPEEAHHMLTAVTDTLVRYVEAAREAGADGLFFSVNGANRPPKEGGLDAEQFAEFVAPYDRKVLEAAAGMIRIGHIHGFGLEFDRVLSYPVEVYNWSHHHSAPSLAEARRLTDKAFIGGISEVRVFTQTPAEVAADIRASVEEAGRRKFLVGPGCTVPPDTAARTLRAIVQTVRTL